MKNSTLFKITGLIVILTIVVIACKKGNDQNATVITDAVVYNSGAVAADDCGWIIKTTADSTYSPTNLADQYKVDQLKIHVRFHPTGTKFICGWGTKLSEISIDNITKAN